jgi:hypothetical protein
MSRTATSQPKADEPAGPADYGLDAERRLVSVKFRNKGYSLRHRELRSIAREKSTIRPGFFRDSDRSEVEELDIFETGPKSACFGG